MKCSDITAASTKATHPTGRAFAWAADYLIIDQFSSGYSLFPQARGITSRRWCLPRLFHQVVSIQLYCVSNQKAHFGGETAFDFDGKLGRLFA